MKQKILKPLHNTIHRELDDKTLDEAIAFLKDYKDNYYQGKEVVISWEQAAYEDYYELALYERIEETDEEEAARERQEAVNRLVSMEYKRRQLERLKKELGED